MTTRRYPLAPFLQLTGWSLNRTQEVAPCNGTEWRLRNEHGVTELIGDRLACAAGFHPHEIWPEMLDHAIADLPDRACAASDCTERFLSDDPRQKFCTPRCKARAWARAHRETQDGTDKNNAARRRYYADHKAYERGRQRRSYWADPERERARKRTERARKRPDLGPRVTTPGAPSERAEEAA